MLIGDLIISSRELMPDLPATVLNPPGLSVVVIAFPGSNLTPATYFVKGTLLTLWGETIPVEAGPFVVAANQALQCTITTWPGVLTASARLYFPASGGLAGTENVYYQAVIPISGSAVITLGDPTLTGLQTAFPPTRSTAFLPDSNGRFVSVGTLYRWLNEALTVASYVCKGIPDVTGIQMVSGQGFYTMPGIWEKFENCWYDGFPVAFDARSGAFYRNVLSGITFIGILQTNSDRQILELQPQPSRSGGTTTLSASIGTNDTTIPLVGIAQFGLPLGMAQVGTEIISYGTLSGGSLAGCSRGLGGTQQAAWPAGTVVKELNFRFGGLRLNQQTQYQPGQSLTSLQVPPGWAPALVDYLVGRFREAEQNSQGKGESIKSFTSFLKDYLKGTKQTAGPRQVGGSTPAGDGYLSASSGGRIIVP